MSDSFSTRGGYRSASEVDGKADCSQFVSQCFHLNSWKLLLNVSSFKEKVLRWQSTCTFIFKLLTMISENVRDIEISSEVLRFLWTILEKIRKSFQTLKNSSEILFKEFVSVFDLISIINRQSSLQDYKAQIFLTKTTMKNILTYRCTNIECGCFVSNLFLIVCFFLRLCSASAANEITCKNNFWSRDKMQVSLQVAHRISLECNLWFREGIYGEVKILRSE